MVSVFKKVVAQMLKNWLHKTLENLETLQVKVAPLYPTFCDPMDYTVHGILQAEYWSG